jgi:hypothetical protein
MYPHLDNIGRKLVEQNYAGLFQRSPTSPIYVNIIEKDVIK